MKRLRRTMLFCPATEPKLYINSLIYRPDCIIFDLEDAVTYSEKDSARDLLCEAVKAVDFGDVEVFARVNSLDSEFGITDVREVVKAGIRNIRLPMCESKEDVLKLDELLYEVEENNGIPAGTVKIQCAIETPKGVLNAYDIASACCRVIAISFGAEDFTRVLCTERTRDAKELYLARHYIPLAASAVGIDSIDTVWKDIDDMEGFRNEAREAKEIGFSGKSCIHPLQVKEVHKIYAPGEKEIEESKSIITAAEEAEKKGIGVILVNGKMVDAPIIAKANRILERAMQIR
ncbi:MAG TPA: aldolase/citrate lyase family protein [Clostridia bacterium]|nr:aldolase/citrate lyase family protein [Clostridia bacterium]